MNDISKLVDGLNKDLDFHCTSIVDRSKIVSVVVATVMSRILELPESRIDSPNTYFTQNHLPVVNRVVSFVGESIVLDARDCVRHVMNMWRLRYIMAYPDGFEQTPTTFGYFDTYMGVARVISLDTHEFVNKHKECIHKCSLTAQLLVRKLMER